MIEAGTGKLASHHIEIIQVQKNDIKPMSDRVYHGHFLEAKLGLKQMVQNF